MANRLAESTSPYLRQHAENPVDWHEWGPEALAEAARRDVPIFLSVGYAACHWCHVMAHESFSDPAVAAILDRDFVPIKVDREERPDVDTVYMDATVGMTGSGGWPMSVFLTPDGRPFFCGTYFPPDRRHGSASFTDVLEAITRTWRERRGDVDSVAARAVEVIGDSGARRGRPGAAADSALLDGALTDALAVYDPVHGGVGRAPRFPMPVLHTGVLSAAALRGVPVPPIVDTTLWAMADGGVHDRLAGGFARYSVDDDWVVPHFEKMLYDNALLLRLYARRARLATVSVDEATALRCLDVCRGIVAWAAEELDTGRGLASSLDADSPDPATGRSREGAAYAWTPAELEAVLGEEAPAAAALLGVTPEGTFEHGASTLRWTSSGAPHEAPGWPRTRERLLAARRERPAPGRDDKVITEWNAQFVTGLVELAWAERDEGYARVLLDRARDLAGAVTPPAGGRVTRSRLGERDSGVPGVLADHAALATALLLLDAAGAGRLPDGRAPADAALEVLDSAIADFADPAHPGRWFDSAGDPSLPVRPSDVTDGATPSGSSQFAEALLLASVLAAPGVAVRYRELADATLADATGVLAGGAPQAGGWMRALALALRGPETVTVTGPVATEAAAALRHRVDPDVLVVTGAGTPAGSDSTADAATRYSVCRAETCLPPVDDAERVLAELDRSR